MTTDQLLLKTIETQNATRFLIEYNRKLKQQSLRLLRFEQALYPLYYIALVSPFTCLSFKELSAFRF
jgi:hypothetical protein